MDGLYYGYIADDVSAEAANAITTGTDPISFGKDCDQTYTTGSNTVLIYTASTAPQVFTESDSCTATGTLNGTPMSVLQNNPDEIGVGTTSLPGPIAIGNVLGMFAGTWTMIHVYDFADDNLIEYGSDAVSFTFGQKAAGVSFSSNDSIVVPGQKIQLTIDDNGLNLDPTTVDAYTFLTTSGSETTQRSSVSTDSDLKSSLPALGFGDNGFMTISEDSTISSSAVASEATTDDSYVFTETGANTGVFTTHDAFGYSDATVSTTCSVDDKVSYAYAGNTVTLVCATANASATFDAGASWAPSEAASYSVTDDDMNRNASYAETLNVHEDNIIPFISLGEPKWLDTSAMASVTAGSSGITFAASNADGFGTSVDTVVNKTDDSKRVTVTLAAGDGDTSALLTINTGWDASTWGDATQPEEMLFYDICSITNNLDSTAIVVTYGGNDTVEPGPNACSGEIQYSSGTSNINCDSSTNCALNLQ